MLANSYDIETFVDSNNKIIPYCVCFFFKNKFYSVYYEEKVDIIQKSLDIIMSLNLKKENIFYIHNLNFDGLLILSSLTDNKKYEFTAFLKENSVYSIKILYKDLIVEFKCSYKLLPISLKKISYSFNLPKKLKFPYKFSKKENLNYIGKIPDSCYFNSLEDFEIFKIYNKNIFNFRLYSIEYCKRDVRATIDLYDYLFNNNMF
jgi:hypothetical protein